MRAERITVVLHLSRAERAQLARQARRKKESLEVYIEEQLRFYGVIGPEDRPPIRTPHLRQ